MLGLTTGSAMMGVKPTAATGGPVVTAIIPVGTNPYTVAVDPVNHNVYVGDADAATVSVLDESGDADNGKVTASITLGGSQCCQDQESTGVADLAVDPSNHNVYVLVPVSTPDGNQLSDTMYVIDESGDADNGKVTDTIDLGFPPAGQAVDPSNHNVYISGAWFNTLSVVDESGDADNGHITATIGSDAAGSFGSAVAVDPSTHNVYVTDPETNMLRVIDESGDADHGHVIATIGVGHQPEAVAVDPSTHLVYVTSYDDDTLSVVDESGDADHGHVIATIGVGHQPEAVAVDPSTHLVYVVNSNDGTVSMIDESGDAHNGHVTHTIAVGTLPLAVAVDPTTHKVYVANTLDSTLSVINPEVAGADLDVSIDGPAHAADRSRVTETLTVTNRGPSNATATVTDLLIPRHLTVTAAPGATIHGDTLVWTDTSLPAGADVTYRATFTVAPDVDANITIGGVTESANYDPDPTNNSAIASIRAD